MIKQIHKILKTENNRGLLQYLIVTMPKKNILLINQKDCTNKYF